MLSKDKHPIWNFFIICCLSLVISLPCIQCSRESEKPSRRTKASADSLRHETLDAKQEDKIYSSESDSLKALLATATHDTTRLRILDAMAYVENDDKIIAGYNQQIESLAQKVLSTNPSASEEKICKKFLANAIHRKGNIYFNQGEYVKALESYNKSLQLREELGDKKGISRSLNNMGTIYFTQGDYIKALEYQNKSYQLSESLGDKIGISSSLQNFGNIYASQGDYNKALEYYHKSLKVNEELSNKGAISNILINIGNIYIYQGIIPKALEYYNRCLKIFEELGNKIGISVSLNNIGAIYAEQGDYDKALEYHNRSLQIREEIGDKNGVSYSLNNIGAIYAEQSDYVKALEYHNRSLLLREEIGDKSGISASLNNIGLIYSDLGEYTKALYYNNKCLKLYEELGDKHGISTTLISIGNIYLKQTNTIHALNYAKKAYEIAGETGNVKDIGGASKLLEKIYAIQGNYKLSRQYLGEYITMHDSINKLENQELSQKIYYQYQYEKKAATDSIAHSKAMEISNLEIAKRKAESRRQRLVIISVATGLLLVLVFAGLIFRSLRITRKQKNIIEEQKKLVDEKNTILNEQNEEIRTQRDEIEAQRDEITTQRDTVTEQKEHIEHIHLELTDSIRYAKRIQKAVLPSLEYIKEITADCQLSAEDYFILYKPRDIVSGDFYFFGKRKNMLQIAAADCTGHGVPGAFMSMLGVSFLNEIIAQEQALTASQILDELRNNIIHSLQQKGIAGEQQDGMDITFVSYDPETKTIQFAGANNPLYVISNDTKELIEIKSDRMPVAIYESMEPFTNHEIKIHKGDILYFASDGYQDQFGGPKGKKFLSKHLKELLTENCHKPMAEQKEVLDKTIEDWKNNYAEKFEQTDDITIMGIKLS